jgi:hypothetical protein
MFEISRWIARWAVEGPLVWPYAVNRLPNGTFHMEPPRGTTTPTSSPCRRCLLVFVIVPTEATTLILERTSTPGTRRPRIKIVAFQPFNLLSALPATLSFHKVPRTPQGELLTGLVTVPSLSNLGSCWMAFGRRSYSITADPSVVLPTATQEWHMSSQKPLRWVLPKFPRGCPSASSTGSR